MSGPMIGRDTEPLRTAWETRRKAAFWAGFISGVLVGGGIVGWLVLMLT